MEDVEQFQKFLADLGETPGAEKGRDSEESTFTAYIKHNKSLLLFLLSFLTVAVCCIISQVIVRISKNYRITLNKLKTRQKFEKARMIQDSRLLKQRSAERIPRRDNADAQRK